MVNKKKIWKDRYRGKQDKDRYRGKQHVVSGKIVTVVNIFTVVNKKTIWKDRYRGKQDLKGSLPW